MLNWTDQEWERAERQDPIKTYIDVPWLNRYVRLSITCFVALVLLVMAIIWWGHHDISEIMRQKDAELQSRWFHLQQMF